MRKIRNIFSWFEKLVLLYPEADPKPLPTHFFSFVWSCTQGVRPYILIMTILTAAIGAFEALLFSLMGYLMDWLSKTDPTQLWSTHHLKLSLFVALLLASIAIVALQTLFKFQVLFGNIPMRLRWYFHRLMLSHSLTFFHNEFAGRITTKVMQTALAVRDTVGITCDVLVYLGIYFISVVVVLVHFDYGLLIPFVGWCALYGLASSFFVPRLSKVAKAQADGRSLMTGRINDAYTNIATVKLFSHSYREADYVRTAMQDFMVPVYAQGRLIAGFEIINHTLNILLVITTSGTALWLWTNNQIGVGAVAAAIAMALRFNGISNWAMWEISALFEHVGTVRDGMKLFTHYQSVKDHPAAIPLQVTQGDIRFSSIDFAYDHQKSVLDNFSLHVHPGEKVGLVGRSGAGKSTIVNLLLRFYDLQQGQIKIDQQDIALVTQESLRRQIGMVTQDTSLLHRSVRENILYGRPDATEEMMIAAAKRAQAHDFILGLVDAQGRRAYDAYVGEHGVKLSGGQRQRVAIARVMLKDAPILLLDEATSALDSEVEAAIQANLYQLMQGKTVIAIAHRLSTIAAMDRLIVLDQGNIVEVGSHKQLLAQDGLYARLWAHQSGGFLGNDE